MGLRILGPDTGKCPRPTVLELTCDGEHETLVKRWFAQNGYIAQRHAAVVARWRFNDVGKVFCPACR